MDSGVEVHTGSVWLRLWIQASRVRASGAHRALH